MLAHPRQAFRYHPLDGAALYFQPATGVHVRVETPATEPLRRHAPRVAMFGITNACNLACEFCSRDITRPSAWTVATAAAALSGLHDAGTLEVAYGGGEPFAFRGFAELVAELDATTTLAQHVTTNGTLIRPATWSPYAGRFGQVRISIYDGTWRVAADTLAGHRQRWGANLLVDRAALPVLPARLAELAARGCHDVSLLSYVGPDRTRHLDAAGDARLAEVIADSPIACRLSVCFGDRVPAPRLFHDGDCGAGRDFLSITPDRRVQSCSFQDRSLPGATAEEILAAWRLRQPMLAAPSPRAGCALTLPLARVTAAPPIAIWQAFSGNNSGECVLVAKFREVADAESFLAELVPTWTPETDYPPAWRALFVAEGVLGKLDQCSGDEGSPRELVAIGRSVIALRFAVDDAFPALRALAWKRGALVVPGGIHVHDDLAFLVAIQSTSAADRDRLTALPRHSTAHVYPHGDLVLLVLPFQGAGKLGTLVEARDEIVRIADGRPFAVELVFDGVEEARLIAAKQHLGHRPPVVRRLWVNFWGEDNGADAIAFARTMPDERTTAAGGAVLIDPAPDRKRLAILAHRRGGNAMTLDSERIVLRAAIWIGWWSQDAEQPTYDRAAIEATLRAELPRGTSYALMLPDARGFRPGPNLELTTHAPAPTMTVLAELARSLGGQLHLRARDLDPLGAALRRVVEDLGR
jgi:hypothetical protein